MKQVSSALAALFASGQFVQGHGLPGQFVPFDLYTITTAGGLVLTYTTADFPISAPSESIFSAPAISGAGNVWFSGIAWQPAPIDMTETKAQAHWKIGLDSDTWVVKFAPRPPGQNAVQTVDLIGDVPWLQAAAAGVLDNADCIVSRAYFASMPGWPMPAAGAVPVGTMIMFRGYLGEVDLTTTSAVLTINDYRQLMQGMMPRNLYTAGCRYKFGSARCGVNLASYAQTGAASGSSAQSTLVASANVAAPGGSATYELGILKMTSGKNAGFSRTVRTWDGSATFVLMSPFPYPIAAGDGFSVSAGCHKTTADCTAFSNLDNFGAYPFVPVPDISLG